MPNQVSCMGTMTMLNELSLWDIQPNPNDRLCGDLLDVVSILEQRIPLAQVAH